MPSERHWHRPKTFIKTIVVTGATWYIYACECGQELPERKTPVQGIPR